MDVLKGDMISIPDDVLESVAGGLEYVHECSDYSRGHINRRKRK